MFKGIFNSLKSINNGGISEISEESVKVNIEKRIRGKRFTRGQMKTLQSIGMSEEEINQYLIHKTSFVQEGDSKRLRQSKNKVQLWELIHKDTGELKEVYL